MSEQRQPHFYFSNAEILQRIFIVYGNLSDFYITPAECWYSFYRAISSHLRHMGYETVIIFNGTEHMECPDEESARIRREKLPTRRERAKDAKKTPAGTAETAPAPAAAPAPKKHSMLAAVRSPAGSAPAPRPAAAKEESDEAPLRFTEDAANVVEYLDEVMRCMEVRAAVVLCNCSALLDEQADRSKGLDVSKLASRMSMWYGLPAENENIAVMLFDLPRIVTLHDAMMNQRRWNFLFERAFEGTKVTDAVIRIGSPRMDEIRYMLTDNVPEYVSPAALREIDETCTRQGLEDAANFIVQQNEGSLKSLKLFFRRHPDDAVLSLMREYSTGSRDALEVIRTTEGWEEVYRTISGIIESNRPLLDSRSSQELPIFADTNLRMAHDEGMSATTSNLSLILTGSPGTGKTTVVQHIATAFRQCGLLPSDRVVKVTRADLVAGFVGQTAIQTTSKINEAIGGVLFVDEAYTLFRKGHDSEHSADFGREALDTLMEAVTSRMGEISIILAGYPEEMAHMLTANPGLPRRFLHNIINIPDYRPPLLERIFLKHIHETNEISRTDIYPKDIRYLLDAKLAGREGGEGVEALGFVDQDREDREEDRLSPISIFFDNWYADRNVRDFGNAGAAKGLAVEIMKLAQERTGTDDGDIIITQEDFEAADERYKKYFINRKPSLDDLDRQLEDVVGMDSVKEKLRTIVAYLRTAQMRMALRKDNRSLAPEPGHYLFIGKPGTGKTMISEKLGMALCSMGMLERFRPIRRTGLDLINTVSGHADGISSLKREIESYNRGVLVVDEAHQLAEYEIGSAVIKCLLDPMIEHAKEFCVVFCCYPNRLQAFLNVEPGLRRRIKDVFMFEDYTPAEIREIFRLKATKAGYILSDEALAEAEAVFTKLRDDEGGNLLENGGSAEKLLNETEVSMALRMRDDLTGVRKPSEIRDRDPGLQERLFIVEPEDIRNAGDRMIATQREKFGGAGIA